MASLGIDIGGTSVKLCLLDGQRSRQARSSVYANPTREEMIKVIREAISRLPIGDEVPVGLCLPGRKSPDRASIEVSVNLPCLEGWAFVDLLECVMGYQPKCSRVISDVRAGGEDFIHEHKCSGRTAIIAIGTGVGLAVFDDNQVCRIGRHDIGHLGMMDIGRLGDEDVVAPDGSVNTLESYVGARAIERRFSTYEGTQLGDAVRGLAMDEPMMIAIVRMIRVVHAIYVPDQVVLMGGVGNALESRKAELESTICDGLTSLAKPGWKLMFGDSPFHAARGAARSVGA